MSPEDYFKQSQESGQSFFARWSILSGGTLTLLIAFLESLNGNITHILLLRFIEIFLIISLITSSLHSWLVSRIAFYNSSQSNRTRHVIYSKLQTVNHRVAIIFYIIAIVLLFIFINANLIK
jgi:hypothetical protein